MNIKSSIEAAESPASELAPEDSASDILETLKKEHREVKALLARLQEAEGAKERSELVRKIKSALVPHTKAEEKVVYDAIIAIGEDEAKSNGYEGYLEHEWAAKTLERLEQASPTSAEHKAAAKVLKEQVEHHVVEEEGNVWSDVREHFNGEDRARMEVEFQAAKKKIKIS